jgi:hypothetical protein
MFPRRQVAPRRVALSEIYMLSASVCAADALEPGDTWNASLQAMSRSLRAAGLKRIPVADHIAYDAASIGCSGRMLAGTTHSSQPVCS